MWKAGVAAIALGGAVAVVAGQLDQQAFKGTLDHPAIQYATRPLRILNGGKIGRAHV